ncbi:PLDc N-terminal domain-containing protein [Candidatus Laterigemmans baculatus]|uniref:PLDc N-terminal domain-containing protein n=1 Tax=Candidatus Laterigemmans baculatus TaxID=2770505 RepID=UPI0013D98C63|nr:PLDc N-terminal domain-containing protein [Candidatus Laterigemmans baculatus]
MRDLLFLAQNDAGGLWVGGLFFLWLILGILALVLWVWALVSAIQNPALDSTMRIVWVLVFVFTGFIGAIIYLLIGRNSRSGRGEAL